jgi:hypothetical protein
VPRSLSYDTYLDRFVLVGNNTGSKKGAYYSLSPDLINWSDKQLIFEAPTASSTCDGPSVLYPSIADPADTTVNFERPGRTPDVFFSCFNSTTGSAANRTMFRVPVKFRYRSATFEDGAAVNQQTGFDSVDNGSGFTVSTTDKYEGTKALKATASGTAPRGNFDNLDWRDGSDVWYSAAFKLPSGFASSNGGVGIMKWENTAGTRTGGVVLQYDDSFALERNGTPIDAGRFYLPENRWFWLEVHQRLDARLDGARPLSEVFVDGSLVWTSTQPNNFPDSDGVPTKLRFGYASGAPSDGYLFVDRATASESQRGAYGAPGGTQVPRSPTDWTVDGQDSVTTLFWQSVPGATGYRIYRRAPTSSNPNPPWQQSFDTTGNAMLDTGLTNGRPYQYRITAYNAAGESMFSAPREATPGGRIVVHVDVRDASDNDVTDPQDFQYTASANAGFTPALFVLDDDTDAVNPSSKTSAWVGPGSGYTVAQVVPPGWQQVSATCDNGSTPANINVTAGETTHCWFVNRKL